MNTTGDDASIDTSGVGGEIVGGGGGLVAVIHIKWSCMKNSHLEKKRQIRRVGGVTNISCSRRYDTKPSAGIIAHGVGMISAHSVGA